MPANFTLTGNPTGRWAAASLPWRSALTLATPPGGLVVIGLLMGVLGMVGCSATPQSMKGLDAPTAVPLPPPQPMSGAPVDDASRPAFERAYALVDGARYGDSAAAFSAWLDAYGRDGNPLTPNAMFWLGYSQEKLGKLDESLQTYARLQQLYPATPAAKRAAAQVRGLTRRSPGA